MTTTVTTANINPNFGVRPDNDVDLLQTTLEEIKTQIGNAGAELDTANTKLAGIEEGADVTDSTNVAATITRTSVALSSASFDGTIDLTKFPSGDVLAQIRIASNGNTGSQSVGTVTAGWRPDEAISGPLAGADLDSTNISEYTISTAGVIVANIKNSTDATYSDSTSWRVP